LAQVAISRPFCEASSNMGADLAQTLRCPLLLFLTGLSIGRGLESNGVIVQLFEWRWSDVAKECTDFLGPKGFAAVQISPPVEHVQGPQWYTRYQPVSYNLTSRGGNEAELRAAIAACKEAGVKVYVDAVFNHMAGQSGVGVAGTPYDSDARTYAMYSPEDFHHLDGNPVMNCRVTDFTKVKDKYSLQTCDILGMPDLCTACPSVRKRIGEHLRHVLDMGAGGLRIDAAKHMDDKELNQLLVEEVLSHGYNVDFTQEVFSTELQSIREDMYLHNGMVEFFEYYENVSLRFRWGRQMDELPKVVSAFETMIPSDKSVVFLDNHDMQRDGQAFLYYQRDALKHVLASVFMLAWPYGIPKLMSSYYFDEAVPGGIDAGPPPTPVHAGGRVDCGGDTTWVCEHRIPVIANMVAWRRAAGASPVSHWTVEGGNRIAFSRGDAFVALNRRDLASEPWEARLRTTLPEGTYCDVAQSDDPSSCPRIMVRRGGIVEISLPAMTSLALHTGCQAASDPAPHAASASTGPGAFGVSAQSAFAVAGAAATLLLLAAVGTARMQALARGADHESALRAPLWP